MTRVARLASADVRGEVGVVVGFEDRHGASDMSEMSKMRKGHACRSPFDVLPLPLPLGAWEVAAVVAAARLLAQQGGLGDQARGVEQVLLLVAPGRQPRSICASAAAAAASPAAVR
jgi:hypothetical protein